MVDARKIAEELGIVGRMPCLLVICHYFHDGLYTHALASGTSDEVASTVESVCAGFYDANARTLSSLSIVEDALDASLYSSEELRQFRDALDRVADAFARAQQTQDNLVAAIQAEAPIETALTTARLLPDVRLADLVPPGHVTDAPEFSDIATIMWRILNNIQIVKRAFTGERHSRRSTNEIIETLRETDSGLLGVFNDAPIRISIDYSSILQALRAGNGAPKAELSRQEHYLYARRRLGSIDHEVSFSASDFGPLLNLAKLVVRVQSVHPGSAERLSATSAAAIEPILMRLDHARRAYEARLRQSFDKVTTRLLALRNE